MRLWNFYLLTALAWIWVCFVWGHPTLVVALPVAAAISGITFLAIRSVWNQHK